MIHCTVHAYLQRQPTWLPLAFLDLRGSCGSVARLQARACSDGVAQADPAGATAVHRGECFGAHRTGGR
ncbi:hypothetical protein XAP6164_2810005 [Xanthomonas phaseoli pv. phaseoli]|nr:hypothetical protein XAP6164_2810005 [Xanthomonas phaseoli pv. phaseoli]